MPRYTGVAVLISLVSFQTTFSSSLASPQMGGTYMGRRWIGTQLIKRVKVFTHDVSVASMLWTSFLWEVMHRSSA